MIYLDNSATTRPFDCVIDEMQRCMKEEYYNISAGYRMALEAQKKVDCARKEIASVIGCDSNSVYFTSGGTESDNMAILGVAATVKKPSDFYCSAVEHPAVLNTMERVKSFGHKVIQIPVNGQGQVDLQKFEEMIDENISFVSVMHVNNETGTIQPICKISEIAKKKNPNCLIHCDAVQAFLRVPVDMKKMGIDMYSLSGHKIHGPKGVGALAVADGVRIQPLITGGGQEKGLRAGTVNSVGICGMNEAVCLFKNGKGYTGKLYQMKKTAIGRLESYEFAHINGPDALDAQKSAPHILSVSFEGVRGEVLRNALEGEDIIVSTGSACSTHRQKTSSALRAMGLNSEMADGTIRISFGLMNTDEEVHNACDTIIRCVQQLRRFRRR